VLSSTKVGSTFGIQLGEFMESDVQECFWDGWEKGGRISLLLGS